MNEEQKEPIVLKNPIDLNMEFFKTFKALTDNICHHLMKVRNFGSLRFIGNHIYIQKFFPFQVEVSFQKNLVQKVNRKMFCFPNTFFKLKILVTDINIKFHKIRVVEIEEEQEPSKLFSELIQIMQEKTIPIGERV